MSQPPPRSAKPAAAPMRIGSPRFTLTVQDLEEHAAPRTARYAVLLACSMIAGFLGWASWFPVTERATALGEITPQGQVQPVQHPDGGVVAELLVQAGSRVEAGQLLVRLDPTLLRTELDVARAREVTLTLAANRFAAAAEGRLAEPETAESDAFDAIRDSQAALAEAGLRLRAGQLAVIDAELARSEANLRGLVAQLDPSVTSRDLARMELNVMIPLLRQGLARRAEVFQLNQSQLRQVGEVTRLEAEIAAGRAALDEVAARRNELASRIRLEALTERARLEGELAEIRQQRSRAETRLQRLDIVSPVQGVVKDLAPRGPGGVIEPGGLIAEIVPVDRAVFAVVELAADQTAGVAPGKPARVKLLSYDATRYGSLPAQVEQISASSFRRQDGSAFFRVRLSLDEAVAAHPALLERATPGLTLMAEINTGQQSLLSWLGKPVRNAMDRAFAER